MREAVIVAVNVLLTSFWPGRAKEGTQTYERAQILKNDHYSRMTMFVHVLAMMRRGSHED